MTDEKKPESKKPVNKAHEDATQFYHKACQEYDVARNQALGARDPGKRKELMQEVQLKLKAKQQGRDRMAAAK